MSTCLITGLGGLVGSACARHFHDNLGMRIVGVENNMRKVFFGEQASISSTLNGLIEDGTVESDAVSRMDVRERVDVWESRLERFGDIDLIIHAAAQPSHDWAAGEPDVDFAINAVGTLNALEFTRRNHPTAVFIFTSTNKVYGDMPNSIAVEEYGMRYDVPDGEPWRTGISEDFPIDRCLHSLFGASKVAADIMVQEYGRYFGLKTGVFRCGCLTGVDHHGAMQHGFLSYLVKCIARDMPYTVFGYKGKQVRDNLDAADLARAFELFYNRPSIGSVYNIGGGRDNSESILEVIARCKMHLGTHFRWDYRPEPRKGDHRWYITDFSKFKREYGWKPQIPSWQIMDEMCDAYSG
jgi:CDP-paratose 2-epimerase